MSRPLLLLYFLTGCVQAPPADEAGQTFGAPDSVWFESDWYGPSSDTSAWQADSVVYELTWEALYDRYVRNPPRPAQESER